MEYEDPRISQAKMIAETLIPKTSLELTDIMITSDNKLIIIRDNTLLYIMDLKDIVGFYPAISFSYSKLDQGSDKQLLYKITNCYQTYMRYMCQVSPLVADIPNLKENEEFSKLLDMKSGDKLQFFKVPGIDIEKSYIIPVFNGFPNLNKSDTIGIKIYDMLDNHLLIQMIINKKKIGRVMNVLFRTLKL